MCAESYELKESYDRAIGMHGHPLRRGLLWQSRHRHDITGLRDNEAGAGRRIDLVDRHTKSLWRSELARIIGERVLRFRHTNRRVAESDRLEIVDRTIGFLREINAIAAVDFFHDCFDLLADRERRGIQRGIFGLLAVQ